MNTRKLERAISHLQKANQLFIELTSDRCSIANYITKKWLKEGTFVKTSDRSDEMLKILLTLRKMQYDLDKWIDELANINDDLVYNGYNIPKKLAKEGL